MSEPQRACEAGERADRGAFGSASQRAHRLAGERARGAGAQQRVDGGTDQSTPSDGSEGDDVGVSVAAGSLSCEI